jgi:hypothetical protein
MLRPNELHTNPTELRRIFLSYAASYRATSYHTMPNLTKPFLCPHPLEQRHEKRENRENNKITSYKIISKKSKIFGQHFQKMFTFEKMSETLFLYFFTNLLGQSQVRCFHREYNV